MSIVRDYFEGEFNPLLMSIDYTHDPVYDVVERVFGSSTTPEEREKIRDRVKKIRAYSREKKDLYFKQRHATAEPARIEDLVEVKKRLKAVEFERVKENENNKIETGGKVDDKKKSE